VDPEDLIEIASSHRDTDHVSTEIRRYAIPGLPITIVDPWGINDTNYKDNEFPFILEGNCGDGFQMGTIPTQGKIGWNRSPTIDDMVHGVIIVLSAPEAKEASPDFFKRIDTFRKQMTQRGFFFFYFLFFFLFSSIFVL
jgi:hypothetical protein